MRVLMLRSIVEGSRALHGNQVYELADDYARRLIRQGKCEAVVKPGARGQGSGVRTTDH